MSVQANKPPRDRRTLESDIRAICETIAGEWAPVGIDPFLGICMWRCPEPSYVSVATMRRLHSALTQFIAEADADCDAKLLRETAR